MENVESIYPLSPMQLDILLRSLRAPEMAEYTEQICWTMEGDLDAPAFERAWQALVDRQPVLRTVFFWEGLDTPLQVVRQKVEVRVEVRDWRDVPPAEREERVGRLVRSERRGFDLEAAPLFRVACVRTGERTYRVAWSCHHLLLDGWSSGVALRELFAFYDAFRTGGVPVLDPPPSFQAYVSWLQAQPVGDAERFWRASLAGVEAPTALPVGHAHDPRAEEAPGQAEATLPASLAERLRETAQRRQLTLNTLFQGAWAILLARYAGEDDVVFGTVSSGRPATLPRADSTLGVFLGTVPVRVRVDPGAALAPWLKEIQADQARARQHDHFSLRQIQEWSGVPAGERLFDTLLLFQNFPFREVESARVAGLELRDVHHAPARTALGHALMLEVSVRQDVVLNLSYDGNRFDAATADRVLEHLRVLLEQVADDPDRRLAELSPLSGAERARVLEEWSATAAEFPGLPVHRLVEAQAARTPDAPAVVAAEGTLTYAELERRSGRLARFLAGRGVGPDRRVGVCMERGHELVVAVLAVLRAGGCYVPLDPAYPAERLAYMLRDSGAAVLLTQSQLAGALPPTGAEVLCVDALRERIAEEPAGPPLVEADAESLAYVIYTSGSTGRPKGVAMPHRALANLLAWQVGEWRGPRAARTLQFASASFDVSFQEVFSTWAAGGTLVIPTEEERHDPDALLRLMEAEGVERCFLPPVALQQVAERGTAPSRLREVVTAGEQLRVTEAVRGWLAALRAPLHNQYGPTETHVVTSGTLEGDPGAWPLLPAIGGPVANTRSRVLDARMEPVPAGVPGELYVGGACLARGYLDRPDATAERFLPDPFAREPGARVYRTGDRVRWLADGTLEFLGRADQQVKVRGFRVEPGEVEAVLEEHPAVRAAAVVAREDAPGERRLVGYVVPDGAAPSGAELRAWLRERLPEHMVPSALVALDALPLTPSGKTDRRALPAPEGGAADGEYVAPRTPTEEILAGIWAAVLKTGRVGVHDDFAALGGHSLLATRVVSRAREALGTELPVRAMFEAPTVAALAERVEEARRAGAAARTPPLAPVPRDGSPLPLSFAQQRLWFIDRLEPGRAAYNMPYPLRVRGALELRALERALTTVVRRHESLRTRFPVVRGEPVQHVEPPRPVWLPVVDLTRPAEAAREAELARLVAEEARRPFDLAAGPVLRTTAVRLGPDDAALLFTLHHIVSDGWSLGVLVREVSALYADGDEARLPELPVQYADFAAWQRAWLAGDALEAQLGWWRGRLAGVPALLELPTDRPRPAVADDAGARLGFSVDPETAEGLRALSRREGASLFMTLLAAWQLLLARHAGQDDVVVGSPIAGRTRAETEGLIGFFVNMLALRADLSGDPPFAELLRQVRETTLEAYRHQDLPFERLVEELGVERSLAHTPLFQAVFSLENNERSELRLGSASLEPLGTGGAPAKFDLTLSMAEEEGGGIEARLEYAAALFDPATAARLAERFAALLRGIAADPDARLSRLPLMSGAERRRVLEEWNDTARPYPAGDRVHDLFARQAARTPDAPALAHGGETLTYAELDRRSGRLARRLRRLGVGPETRVGVCLERTPELVVALLAVLRAGGAWVPLDPAYPRERLGWMMEDAEVSRVLTSTRLAGVLPPGTDVVALDAMRAELEAEPDGAPESGVEPENLSHVIFTSGSTGRPRGVMIRHSSTVVLLRWLRETVTDEERSSVLFSTSVNFDVSVAEVFGTLAWGGKLVLVENALELATAAEPVVHASMVPTAAAELLRAGAIPPSVRTMNLGGEALPGDLAQALYALGTVEKVGNLYGPTEDTTYSTYSLVEKGAGRVLIGRPVANTRAYVLDARLQPVPVGVVGELYLAGDGLARGYARRPELTAERFLPDPFGPAGTRMYRVMDRVRWTASGELEYFGRTDFQVKVRGFRIEPGEVEAALRSHPAVREAVVVAREDAPGERRLVAYVAASDDVSVAELRAHLRERVPEHMVPSAFVVLEALPLTPNGKLDRRALPAPEEAAVRAGADGAPRTPTEEVLAGIWAELLGVERVGAREDFFELGGHSLLAARLAARVREAFGVELPLPAVFEAPTVAELAARVDALRGGGAGEARPPLLPVARDRPLPLSFAQQRLWFVHQVAPASHVLAAALRLRGGLSAEALRGALEAVVARHEALRTRFVVRDGEPVQVVEPVRPFTLRETELAHLPEAEREAAVARHAAEEAALPFDLASPPLLRATLLRLSEREHVLLLTLHHIAADGWSEAVLVRELGAHYGALVSGGTAAALPPLPVQYGDYAAWQRALPAGGARQRSLEFWSRALAGAPAALELPADRPRPPAQSFRGDTLRFRLEAPLVEALRSLARREDATLFMALLAGLDAWLRRYTGEDDLVVGTPLAGRDHPALEPLIGCFINVLPVRVAVDGGEGFAALVRRARSALLDAYPHGDVSFDRIVDAAGIARDAARSPLVQVLLALQNTPLERFDLPGLAAEPVEVGGRTSPYDLSLYLREEPDGALAALVEYSTDLYDRGTVDRWMRHFGRLLDALAAHPERPVGEAEMLDAAEREQALHAWNATDAPWDATATVAGLFEAQVRRTPDAEALVAGGEVLTYAELSRRAGALARRLAALGVGPEVRVGLLLERSAEVVAAMLAVLRAGGAYVPLDPAYPAERLAFMLSDSGARVLVTEAGLAERLPRFEGVVVRVDAPWPEAGEVAPEPAVSPENAAYVVYTSGSTGTPKGVVVTHASVVGFFAAMTERVGAEPGTWLAVTSIGFDISVLEILWTLSRGSKVVLHGPARREAERAVDFSLFYFGGSAEGSARGRYRLLLEGAKWADRNGFTAVWTPERHFHSFGGLYPNPSVTSAALATVTERVRLRAGSVVLPLHDPIRVAEEWAVVDNLSDGRVELSFASGWHADDFVLAPERYEGRRDAMFDGIEEVRRLWRGGTVTRTGGKGEPVEVGTLPPPVQPELPVWVTAAGSPDTFRRAGRLGAHLLTHLLGQSVEELADRVRAYREGRREGGHDPEAGRVALMLHAFVGHDDAEVRAAVRGPFREYLRSSFDLVLRLAGSAGVDPDDRSAEGVERMLDHAFERYYRTAALMGTPEACLETVRRVRAAGVDEVACLIDFGVDEERVLAGLDRLRGVMEAARAAPAPRGEPPLAEQLRAHGVTHLQCTPSLAGMLAADPEALRALGGLECILLGGEALPPPLAARLRAAGPARMVNMYGPTETTVWSTTHEVADAEGPVPIGRPVANTRAYVVDARPGPVPPGVAGELWIGGTGVARGYLDRPELTAERFVPDPFSGEPGARLYRTGDRARRRADGTLEFLGRVDQQVKVRGHRIEPGEVEAALDAHPGVRESVVTAVDDGSGERRLAAYVVPAVAGPRPLAPVAPEERERILAEHARFTLPDGTTIAHQQDATTRGLFREVWERDSYFRHGIALEDGAVVVDVGSNIGMFTLFAHTRARGVRTYSFEPIPATFAVLRANTELFGLDARVFNTGVGEAEGSAVFTFYPNSSGLSGRYADLERDRETARSVIGSWAREAGAGGGGEAGVAGHVGALDVEAFLDERFRAETHTLPVRTLSSVIREEGIERIDLLKVDVEKSEYDVLRGIEDGHWPRIRQVVMEVDTDELLERVTALLGRHGFEWTVERDVTVREGSGEDAGEYVYLLYARRPGDAAAPARSAPPTAAELRAHLAERLPDFMVPSLFVFLESIPRTPGGKTDRRALPPPGAARAEPEAEYVEPRSALERTIAAVWREVLGVERVGARDNFFELGGTSVRLAAVHQALSERLDRPVTVVDLFRYPTVASLAEVLDAVPAGEEEVPEELERVQDRAERQRQARASSARLRGRANDRR